MSAHFEGSPAQEFIESTAHQRQGGKLHPPPPPPSHPFLQTIIAYHDNYGAAPIAAWSRGSWNATDHEVQQGAYPADIDGVRDACKGGVIYGDHDYRFTGEWSGTGEAPWDGPSDVDAGGLACYLTEIWTIRVELPDSGWTYVYPPSSRAEQGPTIPHARTTPGWLRRTVKHHRHGQAPSYFVQYAYQNLCSYVWEESSNGSDWSTLFSWTLADDGTFATSGTELSPSDVNAWILSKIFPGQIAYFPPEVYEKHAVVDHRSNSFWMHSMVVDDSGQESHFKITFAVEMTNDPGWEDTWTVAWGASAMANTCAYMLASVDLKDQTKTYDFGGTRRTLMESECVQVGWTGPGIAETPNAPKIPLAMTYTSVPFPVWTGVPPPSNSVGFEDSPADSTFPPINGDWMLMDFEWFRCDYRTYWAGRCKSLRYSFPGTYRTGLWACHGSLHGSNPDLSDGNNSYTFIADAGSQYQEFTLSERTRRPFDPRQWYALELTQLTS